MTGLARLGVSWTDLGLVLLAALGIYATVVLYTRVAGPRSLASMSSFDFAVTVAIGAIVGRVVLVDPSLVAGIVGMGSLFALQGLLGLARNRTRWGRAIDNRPILLVHQGTLLGDNLRRAHVSEEDVFESVRRAGIGSLSSVNAVVLERSGDVSVISEPNELDETVASDVVGWPEVSR